MGVYAASLNSGSNGNSYYIGNDTEAVLVDIGLSCKEMEKRMERQGLKPTSIKAIFISHEHADHIFGAEVFSKRYNTPVYITPATLANSRLRLRQDLIRVFKAGERISLSANLHITAMQKWHDAADPHSFVVETGGITTGVFTDIGAPCENVKRWFKQCHAAFLEANYDDEMLENGRYPLHLKKRIRGDKGHLSNAQALQLFQDHRHEALSHLWLAHLSRDNNKPELALAAFEQVAGTTKVEVASRYVETGVFRLDDAGSEKQPVVSQPTLF